MLCHHDTSLMHMICTVVKLALEDDYHLDELWSGTICRAWRQPVHGQDACACEKCGHTPPTHPHARTSHWLAGRRQITHMEGSRTQGEP